MTKEELQHIFESEFNWDNWKKVMNFVFPEFKFNLAKTNLPLDTEAKEKSLHSIVPHGQGHLASNESLMLFEVVVKDNVRLDRNVKSVRSFVASESIPNFQSIIAVFHNADNTKWRFTLVVKELTEENKLKDKKPDSYTYVFGIGERGRTAAERFFDLARIPEKSLKDLEKAFSVKALSDKFFHEYKYKQYNAFLKYLTGEEIIKADKKDKYVPLVNPDPIGVNILKTNFNNDKALARDFIKKLLGRLVFIRFLEKKNWMGASTLKYQDGISNFTLALFETSTQDQTFYYQHLWKLFFETLNAKRKHDDYKMPDGRILKVPYLNGGLFEPNEIDEKPIMFPPSLFADLLHFFQEYNFTIIEDDVDLKEVAVDPEMLGHIFENLLEDNKDKGAFYTPKEIVHYMCQQSLYEYLKTYLQQHNHWPVDTNNIERIEDGLQLFVKQKLYKDVANYDKLLAKALKEVKICDPAIGSGAFPMGLLNEIYRCVHKLHDESPDAVGDIWEIGKVWQGNKVKLNIIQNSIYGVDIEKGAIDIARLRFWLSLIIDEIEPNPLPNLDFKIVVGDSLLPRFESDVIVIDWNLKTDSYEDTQQSKLKKTLLKKQRDNLNEVVIKQKEYFSAGHGKKEKKFIEIQLLKLEILLGQVEQEIIKIGKQKEAFGQTGLFSIEPTKKQIHIQEQELKLRDLKKRIEIKIKKSEAKFIHFDWKLDFPEILNSYLINSEAGFDIVIGNPPYLRVQGIREMDSSFADELIKQYKSATGAFDLYILFLEKALSIVKPTGIINYIMPVKWTNAAFGSGLRQLISESKSAYKIINFGAHQIFEASTYTGLQWFKPNSPYLLYSELTQSLSSNEELKSYLNSLNDRSASQIPSVKLSKDSWVLSVGRATEILDKMNKHPRRISDVFEKIFTGLQTSLDSVYFLFDCKSEGDYVIGFSKYLKTSVKIERNFTKPLLKGDDVHRYEFVKTNKVVIFPYKLTNQEAQLYEEKQIIKEFPFAYTYLKQCEDVLRDREKGRFNVDGEWFQYGRKQGINSAEEEKLLAPEISLGGNFSYDEKGQFYSTTKIYGYIKNSTVREGYKFWLGLLNSSLFWFFIRQTGYILRGGYFAFKTAYIYPFPVPIEIPDVAVKKIEKLVNEILEVKQAFPHSSTAVQENEIDLIVYSLYKLTDDDIKIVNN